MALARHLLIKLNLFLILIISIISLCTTTQAIIQPRTTTNPSNTDVSGSSSSSLMIMKRLKVVSDDPSVNCWASLMELQACTGEVIQFFYDSETYLGPGCCRAIRVIEHHCWPAMLSALGFTSEEGDILRGYCDSEDHHQIRN